MTAIGGVEGRRILLRERGLGVDVPDVLGRSDRHQRCVFGCRAGGELIVQSEPHLLQGEAGIEQLRGRRKSHAAASEIAEQIFKPRGPVRRNWQLDAGACGPAEPPQQRGFRRARTRDAARDLRTRQLIVAPGEAAGGIKQPMIKRVADPPANGSRMQHHVAEGRRASERRCRRRCTGKRIGKRSVGLKAEEQSATAARRYSRPGSRRKSCRFP